MLLPVITLAVGLVLIEAAVLSMGTLEDYQ
jgi:hypothetical protein